MRETAERRDVQTGDVAPERRVSGELDMSRRGHR